MRVEVARKKYQLVKELGRFNMSIRSIAFYQLMKVCQAPRGDQSGLYMNNSEFASSVMNSFVPPGIKCPMPFHNVHIQPSNACPRNFVIFDQTNNRSQIMFHPELSSKVLYPTFGVDPSLFQFNALQNEGTSNGEKETGSLLEDDYDDIDLLMSSEYEENVQSEDDEVSTARTGACYECGSPDSCSNYEPSPKKRRQLLGESSGIVGIEKKHKRMRKMVKALRGMVPGTNRMSTVSVLDECVRYLKSLRVEVEKLGSNNFHG